MLHTRKTSAVHKPLNFIHWTIHLKVNIGRITQPHFITKICLYLSQVALSMAGYNKQTLPRASVTALCWQLPYWFPVLCEWPCFERQLNESAVEGRAVPGPSLRARQEEKPVARHMFTSQTAFYLLPFPSPHPFQRHFCNPGSRSNPGVPDF